MFKRFRRRFRFRRRSTRGGGMSYNNVTAIAKRAVSSANRAKSRRDKKKQKKFITIAIVGALGVAGYFFRDKLKALLGIGQVGG